MTTSTRRQLILGSTAWAATHAMHAADATKLKAAIIGHTGAGDYGHGIERVFQNMSDVSVVAAADPHEGGRVKAQAASGAAKGYADYRDMLAKEKPDLVAIGPRWATEHHAMARAARGEKISASPWPMLRAWLLPCGVWRKRCAKGSSAISWKSTPWARWATVQAVRT
jgi:hypothetical protein